VIRVLVVDDHAMVREGLTLILDAHSGIEVIGQCAGGEEFLALPGNTADVVLLDIGLPGMDGLEALRRLRSRPGDQPKVLMLTSLGRPREVQRALALGADGFVLKDSTGDELAAAVRAAAQGLTAMSPSAAVALSSLPRQPLTPRERDVLELLGRGLSNHDIAGRLGLAERTVKAHVGNLLAKLQVSSRTQAALRAGDVLGVDQVG
jgi:DNA-binding NarL/FixJ family response regulator